MGLFSKKKSKERSKEMDMPPLPPSGFKREELSSDHMDLPPPPPMPNLHEMRQKGDLPPIQGSKVSEPLDQDLPTLPDIPPEESFQDMPEQEEIHLEEQEDSLQQGRLSEEDFPEEALEETSQDTFAYDQTRQEPVRHEPLLRETPEPSPEIEYTKHLFVSVNDYQQVQTQVHLIKEKLKETDEILASLHKIKKDQEEGFTAWQKQIEDVEQKLQYIDKMLFQGA